MRPSDGAPNWATFVLEEDGLVALEDVVRADRHERVERISTDAVPFRPAFYRSRVFETSVPHPEPLDRAHAAEALVGPVQTNRARVLDPTIVDWGRLREVETDRVDLWMGSQGAFWSYWPPGGRDQAIWVRTPPLGRSDLVRLRLWAARDVEGRRRAFRAWARREPTVACEALIQGLRPELGDRPALDLRAALEPHDLVGLLARPELGPRMRERVLAEMGRLGKVESVLRKEPSTSLAS